MKKMFSLAMVLIVVSIYGQTSISSNRIAGSSIVLNNLSGSDVQKIMQGTIFDVFNLELSSGEYNTDLKKLTFLETAKGQEYQQRLESVKDRLRSQGIVTIPLYRGNTTNDYVTTIGNYDVNRRGFNLTIGYNSFNREGVPFQPGPWTNNINGFKIPNKQNRYFMAVPIDVAQKIEGNSNAVVQLRLAIDTFAIQKISIIHIETREVYIELDYEG